jgi:hypothetical protein
MPGLALVWLIWTEGRSRVPLGRQLWCQAPPSKYALDLACCQQPVLSAKREGAEPGERGI